MGAKQLQAKVEGLRGDKGRRDGDGDVEEFLGMTSFTYFGAGSAISDPDLNSYAGSLQFYNLMVGR